jgi:hypothetical protein
MILGRHGWMWLWPVMKYYHDICLKEPRMITNPSFINTGISSHLNWYIPNVKQNCSPPHHYEEAKWTKFANGG